MTFEVDLQSLCDANGFLTHQGSWNEDIACRLARGKSMQCHRAPAAPCWVRSPSPNKRSIESQEQTIVSFDDKIETILLDCTAQISRILLSSNSEEIYNESVFERKKQDIMEVSSDRTSRDEKISEI